MIDLSIMPVFACQACIANVIAHQFPFIFPWFLLLVFYFIWEIIMLTHTKNLASPAEREAIDIRLNTLKETISKKFFIMFITTCLFFCCLFFLGPVVFISIVGLVNFIRSAVFFSSKLPSMTCYSLKARYITMSIMIILMMAVTFYLSLKYIPG